MTGSSITLMVRKKEFSTMLKNRGNQLLKMGEQPCSLTLTVFPLSLFTWIIGVIPQGYHVQDPDSLRRSTQVKFWRITDGNSELAVSM
jgi:hypothetical protein